MNIFCTQTLDLRNPDGTPHPIAVTIHEPAQAEDGSWSTTVECTGLPHGSGRYHQDTKLKSLCYALGLLRRFMRESLVERCLPPAGYGNDLTGHAIEEFFAHMFDSNEPLD